MGKNILRLLKFAVRYPGWHSFGKDRSTTDSVRVLAGHGLIEINQYRQFRLNTPKGWVADYGPLGAALQNLNPETSPRVDYSRGLFVGCISTMMSIYGFEFEEAIKTIAPYMPKRVVRGTVPEAWEDYVRAAGITITEYIETLK